MSTESPPPSREELLAQAEDLKRRAEALQRQLKARSRPKYGRIAAILATLVGAGVGTYLATGSVGYTVLAVIGVIVLGIVAVAVFVPTPAFRKPGTRAFEAYMTAELLERTIEARRTAQASTDDPEKRARFDREIAFLSQQLQEQRAVDPSDASPGRGVIGFTPYDGP